MLFTTKGTPCDNNRRILSSFFEFSNTGAIWSFGTGCWGGKVLLLWVNVSSLQYQNQGSQSYFLQLMNHAFNSLFNFNAIKSCNRAQGSRAVKVGRLLEWINKLQHVREIFPLTELVETHSSQPSHPQAGHCQHWANSPVAQRSTYQYKLGLIWEGQSVCSPHITCVVSSLGRVMSPGRWRWTSSLSKMGFSTRAQARYNDKRH